MRASPVAIEGADSYEIFYGRLEPSARSHVDRQVAACQADPTYHHLRLWKRLVGFLAGLSPHSIRVTAQKAVQFYVADGKYRQQVFALEDLRDEKLSLYSVDALDAAARCGVLCRPPAGHHDGNAFAVCASPGELLRIDTLTAAATTSAPEYYRHLLDWNRKAVRISVPVQASAAQVHAVEELCTLAAAGALVQIQKPRTT